MSVAVGFQCHIENLRSCTHLEVPIINNANLILPYLHLCLYILLIRLEVRQVLECHYYFVDYILHRTCPLYHNRFMSLGIIQAWTSLRGGMATYVLFQGLIEQVLHVLFQFHGQAQNDQCVSFQSEHFCIPFGVQQLCCLVTQIGSL